MSKYKTICPCCNNQIEVILNDGEISIFFNTQNQKKLQKILEKQGIDLGVIDGGEKD